MGSNHSPSHQDGSRVWGWWLRWPASLRGERGRALLECQPPVWDGGAGALGGADAPVCRPLPAGLRLYPAGGLPPGWPRTIPSVAGHTPPRPAPAGHGSAGALGRPFVLAAGALTCLWQRRPRRAACGQDMGDSFLITSLFAVALLKSGGVRFRLEALRYEIVTEKSGGPFRSSWHGAAAHLLAHPTLVLNLIRPRLARSKTIWSD